jgi:hypothetical protein
MFENFFIRSGNDWTDLYFNPGSRLRIQSTHDYLLWISWGWKASKQFTINRWWRWKRIVVGRWKSGFHFEWGLISYRDFS